jgi:light-harvesting complex 1 beta chain
MSDSETRGSMLTGLTASEAQEFHGFFMQSTIAYIVVAIVAHFLVWQWRPWFPGVKGYTWLHDSATAVASLIG